MLGEGLGEQRRHGVPDELNPIAPGATEHELVGEGLDPRALSRRERTVLEGMQEFSNRSASNRLRGLVRI